MMSAPLRTMCAEALALATIAFAQTTAHAQTIWIADAAAEEGESVVFTITVPEAISTPVTLT